jgi:hypothetical protein
MEPILNIVPELKYKYSYLHNVRHHEIIAIGMLMYFRKRGGL